MWCHFGSSPRLRNPKHPQPLHRYARALFRRHSAGRLLICVMTEWHTVFCAVALFITVCHYFVFQLLRYESSRSDTRASFKQVIEGALRSLRGIFLVFVKSKRSKLRWVFHHTVAGHERVKPRRNRFTGLQRLFRQLAGEVLTATVFFRVVPSFVFRVMLSWRTTAGFFSKKRQQSRRLSVHRGASKGCRVMGTLRSSPSTRMSLGSTALAASVHLASPESWTNTDHVVTFLLNIPWYIFFAVSIFVRETVSHEIFVVATNFPLHPHQFRF